MAALNTLDINPVPIFSGFLPELPMAEMPGLEATVTLAQSQQWCAPPQRDVDWEKGL